MIHIAHETEKKVLRALFQDVVGTVGRMVVNSCWASAVDSVKKGMHLGKSS